MKKLCILFCITTLIGNIHVYATDIKNEAISGESDASHLKAAPCYILSVDAPKQLQNTKGLHAYYKGNSLDLSEQWCLIPEKNHHVTFTIIITDDIDFEARGNNIRYLKRKPDRPCLWYDITLKQNNGNKSSYYTWAIEQRSLNEVSERIPEHAITLLMPPNLVDTLRSEENQLAAFGKKQCIMLPTVILKNNITQRTFDNAMIESICASLNIDPIHQRIEETKQQDKGIILSMMR
jgi:hypothetical protein